ncbi:hypothetical protein J3F83DRAFT_734415 [Trichoderma novae-zelandiae]
MSNAFPSSSLCFVVLIIILGGCLFEAVGSQMLSCHPGIICNHQGACVHQILSSQTMIRFVSVKGTVMANRTTIALHLLRAQYVNVTSKLPSRNLVVAPRCLSSSASPSRAMGSSLERDSPPRRTIPAGYQPPAS